MTRLWRPSFQASDLGDEIDDVSSADVPLESSISKSSFDAFSPFVSHGFRTNSAIVWPSYGRSHSHHFLCWIRRFEDCWAAIFYFYAFPLLLEMTTEYSLLRVYCIHRLLSSVLFCTYSTRAKLLRMDLWFDTQDLG
jgi:hypothetical protein